MYAVMQARNPSQYVLQAHCSASMKYSFNLLMVVSNVCLSIWKGCCSELYILNSVTYYGYMVIIELGIVVFFAKVTYSAFEFWRKSSLKLYGRAIAVITLHEHFHVAGLQGRGGHDVISTLERRLSA